MGNTRAKRFTVYNRQKGWSKNQNKAKNKNEYANKTPTDMKDLMGAIKRF